MGTAGMPEFDCMDLAWAPATGLAEWFSAAGVDDRVPPRREAAAGPHRMDNAVMGEG
jgi:hypothetical protein